MQLAKPVYNENYKLLLAAGNTIHPKYLEKLIEIGISHLIVEDKESRGITLDEMLDMPTWMDAIQGVQAVYEDVTKNNNFSIRIIQTIANTLVSEVKRRKAIIVAPSTIINNELRSYAHAVNVTLLSLMVGKALMYNDIQLRDLAIGCLLHDIGKVVTSDEMEHPQKGFDLLRKIREINLMSAHIVYQHHETIDGSGYPRGIEGNNILEFAQICGVANVYENMVSKENIAPHEAVEFIMTLHGSKYFERVVQAFCAEIPSYPPGSKVFLHNKEIAIVTRITSHMQRPVVQILSSGEEIALVDNPSLTILGLVKE